MRTISVGQRSYPADAVEQMWVKRRYRELLFMIDTCQAGSMLKPLYSPNVVAIASSRLGQNSYSVGAATDQYNIDPAIGVPLIDRFTRAVLEFMEGVDRTSNKTMQEMVGRTAYPDGCHRRDRHPVRRRSAHDNVPQAARRCARHEFLWRGGADRADGAWVIGAAMGIGAEAQQST